MQTSRPTNTITYKIVRPISIHTTFLRHQVAFYHFMRRCAVKKLLTNLFNRCLLYTSTRLCPSDTIKRRVGICTPWQAYCLSDRVLGLTVHSCFSIFLFFTTSHTTHVRYRHHHHYQHHSLRLKKIVKHRRSQDFVCGGALFLPKS